MRRRNQSPAPREQNTDAPKAAAKETLAKETSTPAALAKVFVAVLAIGILTGACVTAFNMGVATLQGQLHIPAIKRGDVQLLFLPAAGGLVVGVIHLATKQCGLAVGAAPIPSLRSSPPGGGPPKVLASLLLHTLAAVASLGFANSLGPMAIRVQIGTYMSCVVAGFMKLPRAESELLLAVGAAAGVAAGAGVPLAALCFGLEQVWPRPDARIMYTMFCMVGVAAAVAASPDVHAMKHVLGLQGVDMIEDKVTHPREELPLFLIVGLVCGGLAWLFKKVLAPSAARAWAGLNGLGVPKEVNPLLAGLVTGLAAWLLCPEVLFMGWANFKNVLAAPVNSTDYTVLYLMLICGLKLALTAVSLKSGMPGGLFAPLLMVGATVGGIGGRLVATQTAHLGAVSDVRVYSMVGMSAMLGSTVGVPFTAMMLVFELSGSWSFVIPCACGLAGALIGELDIELLKKKPN